MIKFKCNKCKETKYKLIVWKLDNGGCNIGIYCNSCGKWFKFLSKTENFSGFIEKIEIKLQRKK